MDIIFERFLEHGYTLLDSRECQAFDVLLDLPDQDILAWLVGQQTAPNSEIERLVPVIRKHAFR